MSEEAKKRSGGSSVARSIKEQERRRRKGKRKGSTAGFQDTQAPAVVFSRGKLAPVAFPTQMDRIVGERDVDESGFVRGDEAEKDCGSRNLVLWRLSARRGQGANRGGQ